MGWPPAFLAGKQTSPYPPFPFHTPQLVSRGLVIQYSVFSIQYPVSIFLSILIPAPDLP